MDEKQKTLAEKLIERLRKFADELEQESKDRNIASTVETLFNNIFQRLGHYKYIQCKISAYAEKYIADTLLEIYGKLDEYPKEYLLLILDLNNHKIEMCYPQLYARLTTLRALYRTAE